MYPAYRVNYFCRCRCNLYFFGWSRVALVLMLGNDKMILNFKLKKNYKIIISLVLISSKFRFLPLMFKLYSCIGEICELCHVSTSTQFTNLTNTRLGREIQAAGHCVSYLYGIVVIIYMFEMSK